MFPGLRVDRKDRGIEGSAEVTMTQEEIEDDGRVKDRRRKQKLFGHRDRKWGEGEKDGEWASEKWRRKRRRWQSALFKLTEILTKLRLMQLPFKLYLGELGVNHYLCTNAPVTQRRFNIGQIKMEKKWLDKNFPLSRCILEMKPLLFSKNSSVNV